MRIIFIFLILLQSASAIEIREADNFIVVRNNLDIKAEYHVNKVKDKRVYSLEPNESIILDKGDFEVVEDTGSNLISSVSIGNKEKEYRDLIIAIFVLIGTIFITFKMIKDKYK